MFVCACVAHAVGRARCACNSLTGHPGGCTHQSVGLISTLISRLGSLHAIYSHNDTPMTPHTPTTILPRRERYLNGARMLLTNSAHTPRPLQRPVTTTVRARTHPQSPSLYPSQQASINSHQPFTTFTHSNTNTSRCVCAGVFRATTSELPPMHAPAWLQPTRNARPLRPPCGMAAAARL